MFPRLLEILRGDWDWDSYTQTSQEICRYHWNWKDKSRQESKNGIKYMNILINILYCHFSDLFEESELSLNPVPTP